MDGLFRTSPHDMATSQMPETFLARSIRNGSTGAWGRVPMPPNARISVEETNKLAEWVLTQKP